MRRLRIAKPLLLGPIILAAAMVVCAVSKTPGPSPTPTPRPRLTGGFGRAASTPVAAGSGGQSYSDIVRAASEAKARKEQKSSVAITNESLVTDPKRGRLMTASPRSLPRPTPTATPGSTAAAATTPVSAEAGEAEWRERARSARRRVEELKALVFQLQGDAAALEKDFYRWDDGQYRDGVIKPAWDKKKEELEAARRELATAEQELADLPEKARKAGALPGWLRE